MAIPDYQMIMLPIPRFAGDGQVHSKHEAVEYLADEYE
jgi:restriction endonuclease Mrr